MKTYVLSLVALCACTSAHAQNTSRYPWEEYDKLIQGRGDLVGLKDDLFGDSVDLYSGALSFSTTDVAVPGNNALMVGITRRLSIANREGYLVNDLPFADWDFDVPRLSGVFLRATGWISPCSHTGAGAPPQVTIDHQVYYATEYWHGNRVSIPGRGSQEMLVATSSAQPVPSAGGPFPWRTPDETVFSCLPARQNASGDAFMAHTPDGIRYRFDWQAAFMEPGASVPSALGSRGIDRTRSELYATRAEDRFGNWVQYRYSNASNAPVRLEEITASDGRSLRFTYNSAGHIASISNGSQRWGYRYATPAAGRSTLIGVDLPDGSSWGLDMQALTGTYIEYEREVTPGDIVRTCGYPGFIVNAATGMGRLTHPSGAVGEFTASLAQRGRSNVPMVCNNYTQPNNNPNDDVARYPLAYDNVVLWKKLIRGAGLQEAQWTYSYGGDVSFAPGTGPVCTSGDCAAARCLSDDCAGVQTTTVTGPENIWQRYTFGNSYRYNEGKLLTVEVGTGSTVMETTRHRYQYPLPGTQFAAAIGSTQQPRGGSYDSEFRRPMVGTTIERDAVAFTNTVSQFDALARPLTTVRSSSLGDSRTDSRQYYDHLGHWVLGQVALERNENLGIDTSRQEFSAATGLPLRRLAFGLVQMELAYNADGTVASVTDGNGQRTLASGWKRGIPGKITHPDGFTEQADTDDLGWIRSITDENGYSTAYGYDAMGRITRVSHPANDAVAWNPLARAFVKTSSTEKGLVGAHWRSTETEGARTTQRYYNALLQPVLEETYDTAQPQDTLTQVVKQYDRRGRLVFQSYPARGVSSHLDTLPGVRTTYDALDRVVETISHSELGALRSTITYHPGFIRETRDPRGNVTLESFQVFDTPGYDSPVVIDAPQGAVTRITRDVFGKPVAIERSGPDS